MYVEVRNPPGTARGDAVVDILEERGDDYYSLVFKDTLTEEDVSRKGLRLGARELRYFFQAHGRARIIASSGSDGLGRKPPTSPPYSVSVRNGSGRHAPPLAVPAPRLPALDSHSQISGESAVHTDSGSPRDWVCGSTSDPTDMRASSIATGASRSALASISPRMQLPQQQHQETQAQQQQQHYYFFDEHQQNQHQLDAHQDKEQRGQPAQDDRQREKSAAECAGELGPHPRRRRRVSSLPPTASGPCGASVRASAETGRQGDHTGAGPSIGWADGSSTWQLHSPPRSPARMVTAALADAQIPVPSGAGVDASGERAAGSGGGEATAKKKQKKRKKKTKHPHSSGAVSQGLITVNSGNPNEFYTTRILIVSGRTTVRPATTATVTTTVAAAAHCPTECAHPLTPPSSLTPSPTLSTGRLTTAWAFSTRLSPPSSCRTRRSWSCAADTPSTPWTRSSL